MRLDICGQRQPLIKMAGRRKQKPGLNSGDITVRYGNSREVILELEKVLPEGCLTLSQRQIIRRVHNYLKTHENHITYKSFEADLYPEVLGWLRVLVNG